MRAHKRLATGLVVSALIVAGCSSTDTASSPADEATTTLTGTSDATVAAVTTTSETTASVAATDSGAEEADSSVDADWSSLPTTNVMLTDDGLAITEAGTYVLTGTSTGQVTVSTNGAVRIVLADVTINSSTGAAIQIDNAESTVLELADDTINTVSDAVSRGDDEIDGAIYSAGDLSIIGNGTLNVTANFADGVVGKTSLWIASGTINVTSVDDGIRGKNSLNVDGGTLTIDAAGDGLKSSNDTDLGAGQLTITDGTITIASGDDAIKAEQKIWITGGTIEITESVEGIEAPVIVIDGGDITLNASDDGVNASASDIITDGLSITINDGHLTIVMAAGDTDAIDSNGDLTISGGTLDITAGSSFDFDGTGTLTGGTITVNGQQVTELPNQMGGGPMGGPRAAVAPAADRHGSRTRHREKPCHRGVLWPTRAAGPVSRTGFRLFRF